MISIEHSVYKDLILEKLVFDFGVVYLLEDIILSELYRGEVLDTDKALIALEEVLNFYEVNHVIKKRLWIANKTEIYSTKLIGWIQLRAVALEYFTGFCVVDDTPSGLVNALLESKFVPVNFKNVKSLDEAFDWNKELNNNGA
ncbi:hypothetical protein SAMN05192588_2069 [Nonlabens sp. Hel1_33_55]|uniref:hypothetical protein n=1 Tax=Nonlabens sp. Hel1_33_55 TaxID=1336802 RepID=UPI000875D1BB|nr:hypothetical protein [Nonlabens sp. Hel1_33_55]SCY28893.1 hypothetical protein SAMN05192588_2069 [Nonlabens sp. Hel1_33_55]